MDIIADHKLVSDVGESMNFLRQMFSRRRHFWTVCFMTDNGPRSIIAQYPDKYMTPLRLGMLARQEDYPDNVPVLSVSYLGYMSMYTASARI